MTIDPPGAVVMIRPHHFAVNTDTSDDNRFQAAGEVDFRQAYEEVSQAVETLREAGITVHLFEDAGIATPDSVFPNNWFSTHRDGRIVTYPMRALNRRAERRGDVIRALAAHYRVESIVNLHHYESEGRFLEGTGSMVVDPATRIAYAAISQRTDPGIFAHACRLLNYHPLAFEAHDRGGVPVYHTNVILTLGSGYALVALDMIGERREEVEDALVQSGRDIVRLDEEQVRNFAGNAFELMGKEGRVMALSTRAHEALRPDQRSAIKQHARLLPMSVPTIERAGGSVRCMLAGVHLPLKT